MCEGDLDGHGRSTRCMNHRTARLVNEIWKSKDVTAELHETKILGYTSVTSKTSSRRSWTRALHSLTTKCGLNPSRLKKRRCFLVENRYSKQTELNFTGRASSSSNVTSFFSMMCVPLTNPGVGRVLRAGMSGTQVKTHFVSWTMFSRTYVAMCPCSRLLRTWLCPQREHKMTMTRNASTKAAVENDVW